MNIQRAIKIASCVLGLATMASCTGGAQQEPMAGFGEDKAKVEQINTRIHTLLAETQTGMNVSHENIPAMQAARTIGEQQRIFERSVQGMDRIKPSLDSIVLYSKQSRSIASEHPGDISARVLDSMDLVLGDVATSYRKYADEYDSLWYYLCQVDTSMPAETTRMPWEFQRHAAIKDSLEATALRHKARLQYLTNRWTLLKSGKTK